ncbi:MAG: OadG family protein [Victivallales bacterium]|jgi:oxaloacetate decarboxylase gamma subunit|nr:OadG family protein [Victivallales bacterium]
METDLSLLWDGVKLMVLGMGMVYVFLIIMIIAMNLLKRALAPFAGMLEVAPKATAKKKVATSTDDARLAAIAAIAVEASRTK